MDKAVSEKRPKKPRLKKFTPLVVVWEDAVTIYDPANSQDSFTTVIRRSIGWLITKNKNAITIAMEDDRSDTESDTDCQTVTSIPTKMVKCIIVLEEKKEQ